MASTLGRGSLFNTQDGHIPMAEKPITLRTSTVPTHTTIGHSWDALTDIWKMPNGYHGNINDNGTMTSPDRHDRSSRSQTSNAYHVPASRGQTTNTDIVDAPRNILSSFPSTTSSSSSNRTSVPLASPTKTRSHGLFGSAIHPSMTKLSNASLLSGSDPDVEPTTTNSGFPHRHQIDNKIRSLNVAGVHEFVPSHHQVQPRSKALNERQNGDSILHLSNLEIGRSSGVLHPDSQNFIPEKYNSHASTDQYLSQLPNYASQASSPMHPTNNPFVPALSHFPGGYQVADGSVNKPYLGNNALETSAFRDRAMGQRHTEMYIRSQAAPNPFQASEQYDVEHTNKNAYFENSNMTAQSGYDSRNGVYTPSFTPPTATESQRSNSGSTPSTRASSQAVDSRTRGFEGGQTLPTSRSNQTHGCGSHLPPFHQSCYPTNCSMRHIQGVPYIDIHTANQIANGMGIEPFGVLDDNEDPDKPISPFLKEFRANCKTKRYELKDVYGYIVEFSGDQHGSRFIQGKLETANSDEKEQVFTEIQSNSLQLMTDIFGNYVIQKLFEHGTQAQKKLLANQMKGRVHYLTTQVYGCRVVQKALEHVLTDQQASMAKELEGYVLSVVENQNGNHVIQKAIERVPVEHIQFIVEALQGQIVRLAKHNYGCRVVQRMLEYCPASVKRSILAELHESIPSLIADTFGNYVVQHIIRHGEPADKRCVVSLVQKQLLFYSKHKFASNVVEAAIESSDEHQRQEILRTLTGADVNGQTPVYNLIRDQYGNYVMQKVLLRLQGAQLHALVREIRHHLVALRRISNGKQVAAMEKALAEATYGYGPIPVSHPTHNGGSDPRGLTSNHSSYLRYPLHEPFASHHSHGVRV